ncbi:MAG: DUF305 domain-containing protein [Solirubrobacteraceae bacterium]
MKTNRTSLTSLAALALLALATLVAGCGSDDNGKTSASGNATDAAFITDMTTHHQGAIEMAQVAQTRAGHAEVRTLADGIISAQKGQISVMKRIGDDMRGMGMAHGDHLGMSQSQMGMNMDLPALRRAKPFDRAFIDMMLPHHQGAIAMARKELAKGSQPALRAIAQDTIDAQSREIAQMRKWRKAW